VKISKGVWISQYVCIDEDHPENIIVNENVSIGLRTTIISYLYWEWKKPGKKAGNVIIEKNVYIDPHCVILESTVI